MAIVEQQSSTPSKPRRPRASAPKQRRSTSGPEILTVDPRRCRVWPGNQRALERLNEQRCSDLIESFRSFGEQHTPAFARAVAAKDGTDYEIIAGSRRLWAATWVKEHHLPEFMFRIKLLQISDEEAFWLTDSENRDRDDVSDYERALSYKHVFENFYRKKDKTQQEMADRYDISRQALIRLFKLAELPVQIANAFGDWPDLKMSYAEVLLPLIKSKKSARVMNAATQLHMEQEERQLAGKKPIPGPEVVRRLVVASRVKQGRPAGPLKEFTKDDKVILRVTQKNQHGLTVTVPHRNGATVDDMVESFRASLNEFYDA
jgi:ParB family chromosome partitioning protein